MNLLARLADRALNRPLLITPDKAQVILSVLNSRIGIAVPSADQFEGDPYERDEEGRIKRNEWGDPKRAAYRTTDAGVGIISVVGSLVNRGAYIGAKSNLVSYEGIKHQLKLAAADDRVRSVILDLQTPGGEAVGAFEAAEQVRLLAATKPVIAVVNGMACSAGYALASAATEIVTTETGVNGSIGVVLLHADFSRALANDGITPTLIFAGAHKVDGNPFEPLPPDVRDSLKAEVDAFYSQFLNAVEKGRGKRLTAEMARATEARTFIGEQAVAAGLADRLGTFESVLEDLSRAPSGRSTSPTRRTSMSDKQGAPAADESAGITKADHDAAVSKALQDGRTAGAAAERERMSAILSADGMREAPRKLAAAVDLALKSPAMSAEDVVAFVSANVATEATSKPETPKASLDNRASDADPLAATDTAGKPAASGLSRLIGAEAARMKKAS